MNSIDRASAEAQIIKKAMKDSAFRASLIANPNAAIEQALGLSLPAGVNIKVYEDTADTFNMVLPAASSSGADQASAAVGADDCSGWSSATLCAFECTQCGNNDTSCQPGPTEG